MSYTTIHQCTRDCRKGDCPQEWEKLESQFGEENLCAYCGEDSRKNPLKHLNELAEFLKGKIKILNKI